MIVSVMESREREGGGEGWGVLFDMDFDSVACLVGDRGPACYRDVLLFCSVLLLLFFFLFFFCFL